MSKDKAPLPPPGSVKVTKPTKKEILKMLELQKGKIFDITTTGKYLLIVPKDAQINLLAEALGEFMKPATLFVLAVNQVNDIKIAELLEEKKSSTGSPQGSRP